VGHIFSFLAHPAYDLLLAIGAACIVNAIDRRSGAIGRALVSAAAVLLPRSQRARCREEWLTFIIEAGESGARPLVHAVSIAGWAAPRLALLLRRRPVTERVLYVALVAAQVPIFVAARFVLAGRTLPPRGPSFIEPILILYVLLGLLMLAFSTLSGRQSPARFVRWYAVVRMTQTVVTFVSVPLVAALWGGVGRILGPALVVALPVAEFVLSKRRREPLRAAGQNPTQ